jgi:hypothetical protein
MAREFLDSSIGLLKHRSITAILAAGTLLFTSCAGSRTQGGSASTVKQPPAITVSGAPNTIPEGTALEVRTNEAIVSSNAEGRTYQGSISTEVVDAQGNVLLPKGAPVELVILEAKEKNGIKGASLQLGLRSVTVNGNTYLVVSEEVKQTSGLGQNRRTAETVGGGAALGTLIGAATGGGKGAVLGGLVGAAAGAAVQILTQGKEVRIPAESVLKFRLDEPIRLQPR